MERHEGTYDIFFGIEHRTRKDEMEEKLSKEGKQGWRFAVDATRITDENGSSEDCKHTSGGVVVVIDDSFGAVVHREEEAIKSFPGNERRIVETLVNVKGGLRFFPCTYGTQTDGHGGVRR